MVQVKDLTGLTLEDLWREVKGYEVDWWGNVRQETSRLVKILLDGAVEGELVEQLRAGRYRRTGFRRGYRNGVSPPYGSYSTKPGGGAPAPPPSPPIECVVSRQLKHRTLI